MPRANRKPAGKPGNKPTKLAVDFTDVESSARVEDDDYPVKVIEVTQETSDNSGADYLKLVLEITDGPSKGRKLFHNCSLQPQALFNLRGVLEALGFEVPAGVMELDPADMIDSECGVAVVNEKYEGKDRPRCVEFFPLEEMEGGEEAVAPAPAPAATKVVKKAAAPVAAPAPAAPAVGAKKKVKKAGGIQVGSTVTFTDDESNELSGDVKSIVDNTATVVVGDDEWELELAELTLAS